jgi:hypothetical protein
MKYTNNMRENAEFLNVTAGLQMVTIELYVINIGIL